MIEQENIHHTVYEFALKNFCDKCLFDLYEIIEIPERDIIIECARCSPLQQDDRQE